MGEIAFLVFCRAAGMVMAAPVLGDRAVPVAVRLALAAALSALLAPIVSRPDAVPAGGTLALAAASEAAVGLVLGFGAAILFEGVRLAGHLIDQQMGLSLASVLDPVTGEPGAPVANLKLALAGLVYLAIDGHHHLISATARSFDAMPLLGAFAPAASSAAGLGGALFGIALQVAGPALITLFLVSLAMAFLARTAPEVDAFAVGVPARVLVGLGALLLAGGALASVIVSSISTGGRP
jgi:flagellar biosynthetic protein FliR